MVGRIMQDEHRNFDDDVELNIDEIRLIVDQVGDCDETFPKPYAVA